MTSSTSSLGHLPGDRWRFDSAVAAVFDDMLERSIPDYETMRAVTTTYAARLAAPGCVLDAGCSNGLALEALLDRRDDLAGYGLEVSAPMLDAARQRLDRFGDRAAVVEHDLRRDLPGYCSDLSAVLAILTVQFVPIEYRPALIGRFRASLRPGGVLVLVEKVLGSSPRLDEVLTDVYLDSKRAAGYTDEEVERKRLALEGVLVPVTAAWNEDLLRSAGFAQVECVWRAGNFAGWVALA